MDIPAAEVTLLLLLVLFFGLQQRGRPQMYFRFWLLGWLFVLFSYLLWDITFYWNNQSPLVDAVRFDLLFLGVLIFALSIPARRDTIRRTLSMGAAIFLLVCGGVDLQILGDSLPVFVLKPALIAFILLGHAVAIVTTARVLPGSWSFRRRLVLALCTLSAVAFTAALQHSLSFSLADAAAGELCLCTAILYGGDYGKRSLAGFVGVVGFTAWGLFYLDTFFPLFPRLNNTLDMFWQFPKYFVGFSMVLRVFEESNAEKARMVAQYRSLYEEFQTLYETYPYPMWIYDGKTGRVLAANQATEQHYGYSAEEFLAMKITDMEVTLAESIDHLLPVLTEGRRAQHRRKDGRLAWVHLTDRSVMFQGTESRVLLANDITEKVKHNRELSFRAQHDALTGLANRTLLEERILDCLKRSDRDEKHAVLLTIDVDHFKRINDTYGHGVGDACLKEVAARLKTKIRKVDTLARVGGEEFVAIVGGLSRPQDATKVVAALLGMFQAPIGLDDCNEHVTVSIGAALYPDDAADAETLRRLSDDALYRAKRAGRNRAAYASDRGSVLDFKPDFKSRMGEAS
jgi:diguanylate cyclase (GGDEF)-like protein/PAS domain S-box-containing protein